MPGIRHQSFDPADALHHERLRDPQPSPNQLRIAATAHLHLAARATSGKVFLAVER